MVALSILYQQGQDLQPITSALRGMQVIVVALVANAAINFGHASIRNWRDALLAGTATILMGVRTNPLLVIATTAAAGILLYRRLPNSACTEAQWPTQSTVKNLLPVLVLLVLVLVGLIALFVFDYKLFLLATSMLKVDSFAFGGGFASIPLMLHEVVEAQGWMDTKTFMDGIALGQVTPGPIVITATFIGYQLAGVVGAMVGTIAIFSPSFVFVLLAVPYFDRLRHSPLFRAALRGEMLSFVGLLFVTSLRFGVAVQWGLWSVVLVVLAFAALRCKIDIVWVVLLGTVASVALL